MEIGMSVSKAEWTDVKKQESELTNSGAQKKITMSTEMKPQMHLLNCEMTKVVFEKLTSIYGKNTVQTKCLLLQEYFNYSLAEGSDIAIHESTLEII